MVSRVARVVVLAVLVLILSGPAFAQIKARNTSSPVPTGTESWSPTPTMTNSPTPTGTVTPDYGDPMSTPTGTWSASPSPSPTPTPTDPDLGAPGPTPDASPRASGSPETSPTPSAPLAADSSTPPSLQTEPTTVENTKSVAIESTLNVPPDNEDLAAYYRQIAVELTALSTSDAFDPTLADFTSVYGEQLAGFVETLVAIRDEAKEQKGYFGFFACDAVSDSPFIFVESRLALLKPNARVKLLLITGKIIAALERDPAIRIHPERLRALLILNNGIRYATKEKTLAFAISHVNLLKRYGVIGRRTAAAVIAQLTKLPKAKLPGRMVGNIVPGSGACTGGETEATSLKATSRRRAMASTYMLKGVSAKKPAKPRVPTSKTNSGSGKSNSSNHNTNLGRR